MRLKTIYIIAAGKDDGKEETGFNLSQEGEKKICAICANLENNDFGETAVITPGYKNCRKSADIFCKHHGFTKISNEALAKDCREQNSTFYNTSNMLEEFKESYDTLFLIGRHNACFNEMAKFIAKKFLKAECELKHISEGGRIIDIANHKVSTITVSA